MNVAIMIPSMDIGGAERVALYVASHLAENGHNVCFFFYQKNEGEAFECEYEHYFIDYKIHAFFWKDVLSELIIAARETKAYKKRLEIGLSISFMEDCNFINVLSRIRDERIIVSTRTTISARKELAKLVYDHRWIRHIYNRADKVIAVSEATKKDLQINYGVKSSKTIVIPNPAIRRDYVENKEWKYGDHAIVHVGRLDQVKQQDRIIRAFAYVHRNDLEARLLILGDGRLKKYLGHICKKLQLEDYVIFQGFVDDVGFYLRHSKAFVMASKAEGFPNAMVEAMAYGVPVITTDSPGGCGEIVGKSITSKDIQYCKYGILTPYISGKAPREVKLEKEEVYLGKAMLKILEDKELSDEYKKKSIQGAKRYDEKRILKMWDSVCFDNNR